MQTNSRVSNFTNNSSLVLRRTVTGIPVGSLIASAEFVVKAAETDTDSILDKTVLPTDNPGVGQVEDTGTDQTGVVRFDLEPADTALMTPGTKYRFWIEVVLDSNELVCVELGEIFALQGSETPPPA